MREVVGKQNNNAKAIYKINKNMSYLSQLIFFFPWICVYMHFCLNSNFYKDEDGI